MDTERPAFRATDRRPATPAEAKALASPLRLRILRLCLDQALTNKQLAERLGRDPGTVLHHVRTLVATGFLAPDEVRQGAKGALEKPYRSTGKSWTLSLDKDVVTETSATQAMLEAFLAELAEAGPGAVHDFTRLALTLDDDSLKEFETRLREIFDDFAARPPDPGGKTYGLLFGMHLQAGADQPSGSGGVNS
ncbi:MAG TPA: winged helix-turn-helix domain-containing protein [Actinomycetes bacterium]|nr:winged helix-turn-helix domain-containing protein [Actinomycetes bacterium]